MRDDITNIVIEDYLLDLMPPRSGIFVELEKRAHDHGLPLIGPVQGQFLYLLAKSMDAREALEIGTVTGYAAMWLMRAVAPAGGRLTAIERDSERFKLAKDYLTRAGYAEQLVIHQGEWFSVLESIDGPFDLIFLDILRNLSDEHDAVKALELCVSRLRPGGVLIGDNVLCSGLVVEEDAAPIVRGIQEFNRAIMQHPQLESVIIPLRDGVAICRKKD
jgi:predicted O-methyltransferase YrrM